ncbi:hypothetical protein L9F63_012744, partial [Diploptera punctata]
MTLNILKNFSRLTCNVSNHVLVRPKKLSLLHCVQPTIRLVDFFSTNTAPVESKNEDLDKLYKMMEVEVRGHDPAVLKSYSWFATTAANELGITVGECWTPKKSRHERLTLLKSVHIYKKHRVQYEFRTYFHFMQFVRLTGSTADTFLEYIQRNLPEGVAMKVTRVELNHLPSHITMPKKELYNAPFHLYLMTKI